jgi:acid phosphatase (class A)
MNNACDTWIPQSVRGRISNVAAVLKIRIDPDGLMQAGDIVRSSGKPDLDNAVRVCVDHTKRQPARQYGKPVAIDWFVDVKWWEPDLRPYAAELEDPACHSFLKEPIHFRSAASRLCSFCSNRTGLCASPPSMNRRVMPPTIRPPSLPLPHGAICRRQSMASQWKSSGTEASIGRCWRGCVTSKVERVYKISERSRFVRTARASALAIIMANLIVASPTAAGPHQGYLADASIETDLGYKVPPAPDNASEIGHLDLAGVELAQTNNAALTDDAYHDAVAYPFDLLMGRFSEAAGTELSPSNSPILAHVLRLALTDTGAYANLAKANNLRARPYVEDPHIVPCETDYLRVTDMQAYPSGHATNGYEAALILAAVMPERTSALLARGIRYGNNRVVCGVHHPIDVEQGRYLAIAVFGKLRVNTEFENDVACARQEYERSIAGKTPKATFHDGCDVLDTKYRAELVP